MSDYDIIFDMLKGEYAFNRDNSKNKSHENWACDCIVQRGLAKKAYLVDENDSDQRKVRDIFIEEPAHQAEIKKDIRCYSTGNLYMELMSRGKPSGISITKADWWFQSYYCKDGKMRTGIAETAKVKTIMNGGKYRVLSGGDKYKGGRAAEGLIVPWADYDAICFDRFELDAIDYLQILGLHDVFTGLKQNTKSNSTW